MSTAAREAGSSGVSPDALLAAILGFGRELRAAGLAGDLPALLDFGRALAALGIEERETVRIAGEALFVRHRDEIPLYDACFARFWDRRRRTLEVTLPVADPDAPPGGEGGGVADGAEPVRGGDLAIPTDAEEGEGGAEGSLLTWSAGERLRSTAFDRMSADELRAAERAIDRMVIRLPERRIRRWRLHASGRILAPRPMMRRNLATGGDPLTWLWRRPRTEPRSLVLLCDISGSMERHARLLLRFSHALARSEVRTEAFVFGTRLTRITPALRLRDPDRAMDAVTASVDDWSGGTRIGGAFREFNQRWARRVLRTSGIVIVVSDGWDRGDPAIVGTETARLRRGCHRLVWVNPLAGSRDYRPLAAGMAAAYPHLDLFLPGHDLASLEALATLLAEGAGSRGGASLA